MKRLFFFLIVVVASVLPQIAWADDDAASWDNDTHTLTINSSAAGKLSHNPCQITNFVGGGTPSSIKKIVLIGKFNEADLAVIKGNDGSGSPGAFTLVEEVDMADAQFVLTSSGAPDQAYYLLYNTGATLPAGTTGDRAIVGGTLYKSAQNGTWNELNYVPTEGTDVVNNINTSNTIGYAIGTYGKNNPVAKYVQMQITYAWSSGHSIPVPATATDLTNGGAEYRSRDHVTTSLLASSYPEQNVWIYYYYKSYDDGGSWRWVEATKEEYDATIEGSTHYDNPTDADINNLQNNYAGQNRFMRVKVYFTSIATRTWTDKPDGAGAPAQFTDMSDYEYAYRDNHKDGYDNGAWVKLTSWDYYQFQAASGWHWEPTTYSDGEGHYINKKYTSGTNMSSTSDGLPNADNQYAVVMGSNSGDGEYYRNGSSWKDPEDATNTPHYVDMKFSYWSSTLQKATTSKYADEDINPDIFQNCKSLKEVVFNAGVLKGFLDHNASNSYNPGEEGLKVTVGKDVTRIDSWAFKGCDILKTIEFDKDYSGLENNGDYPKVLTIGEYAFLDCINLEGISIPNRVSTIESAAFHYAGNNTQEFSLTFERRYYDDKTAEEGNYTKGKNFDVPLVIRDGAFEDCTKLKSLSLPVRLTILGARAFANSESLTKLVMREDTEHPLRDMTKGNASYQSLQTIKSETFRGSHVEEIVIPSSVTEIEGAAFQQTNYLKKITFQNTNTTPLIIRSGAFAGGREEGTPVLDIYVNVDPEKRKIVCEYNAFTYTQMEGQTSVESHQFAKLHFDRAYWDYYQGNWKRGLAFRQDNLNAFKDGYIGEWGGEADPDNNKQNCVGKGEGEIDPSTGKYAKAGYDEMYVAPANGWQQFAGTSTDIDIIIPKGSFMRTFSTKTPYVIPTYATTETSNGITVQKGAPMFKIYRITAFSDGYQEGQDKRDAQLAQNSTRVAKALEVNDTDRPGRKYIPSETGLMMVGLINADYIVYFADADFKSSVNEKMEKKYPYNLSGYDYSNTADLNANDSKDINLLYPTCEDNQRMNGLDNDSPEMTGEPKIVDDNGVSKILLRSSIPCPYHSYDSDLKFRLFGYYSAPNQFKRVNNAKFTRDKAYLKLPKELFHWANEYNSGTSGGSTSGVTDPTAAAAAREISLSFLEDEEESGTTGIKQIDTTAQRVDSNVFYTLEGVRLNARPTQRGIYIHNGRKIVIK